MKWPADSNFIFKECCWCRWWGNWTRTAQSSIMSPPSEIKFLYRPITELAKVLNRHFYVWRAIQMPRRYNKNFQQPVLLGKYKSKCNRTSPYTWQNTTGHVKSTWEREDFGWETTKSTAAPENRMGKPQKKIKNSTLCVTEIPLLVHIQRKLNQNLICIYFNMTHKRQGVWNNQ